MKFSDILTDEQKANFAALGLDPDTWLERHMQNVTGLAFQVNLKKIIDKAAMLTRANQAALLDSASKQIDALTVGAVPVETPVEAVTETPSERGVKERHGPQFIATTGIGRRIHERGDHWHVGRRTGCGSHRQKPMLTV